MEGVFVESSTQTAEVVMLADTVELEVLAVEPEAGLGIETEAAEARSGLIGVDDLATLYHLGKHRVDIGLLARPEQGVIDSDGRFSTL